MVSLAKDCNFIWVKQIFFKDVVSDRYIDSRTCSSPSPFTYFCSSIAIFPKQTDNISYSSWHIKALIISV